MPTADGDTLCSSQQRVLQLIADAIEDLVHWPGFVPDASLRHLNGGAVAWGDEPRLTAAMGRLLDESGTRLTMATRALERAMALTRTRRARSALDAIHEAAA